MPLNPLQTIVGMIEKSSTSCRLGLPLEKPSIRDKSEGADCSIGPFGSNAIFLNRIMKTAPYFARTFCTPITAAAVSARPSIAKPASVTSSPVCGGSTAPAFAKVTSILWFACTLVNV